MVQEERHEAGVTFMKASSRFVIGEERAVHGRARRFAQRQRTPSGTSVALDRLEPESARSHYMFTAIGFVAIIGMAFAWIKIRQKRKAEGAGH